MVGAVAPDFLQIIMLARNADAFLRIDGAGIAAGFNTKEDVLELVHARVSEHQGGITHGHGRRAVHIGVPLFLEIGNEAVSYFA